MQQVKVVGFLLFRLMDIYSQHIIFQDVSLIVNKIKNVKSGLLIHCQVAKEIIVGLKPVMLS